MSRHNFLQIDGRILNTRHVESIDSETTDEGLFYVSIFLPPAGEVEGSVVLYYGKVAQAVWKYFLGQCNQRIVDGETIGGGGSA